MARETSPEIEQAKAFRTAMALLRGGVAARDLSQHLTPAERAAVAPFVLQPADPAPGGETWQVLTSQPGYAVYDRRVRSQGRDLAEGGAILCRTCWRRSFNPSDANQRYCAGCKRFHHDAASAFFNRGAGEFLARALTLGDPREAADAIRSHEASQRVGYIPETSRAFRGRCIDALCQHAQLEGYSSVDVWEFRLKLEIELGLREAGGAPPAMSAPPQLDVPAAPDSVEALLADHAQAFNQSPFAAGVSRAGATTEAMR